MKRKQTPFKLVPEEIKRIGALITAELATWPEVSVRPMFGMLGAWHGKRMFAAVPHTRSLGEDNIILIKFAEHTPALAARLARDAHIGEFSFGKTKWHRFSIDSEADITAALVWLAEAAEDAPKRSKQSKRR